MSEPRRPKYRVGYNVILTKDIAASIGQPIGDIERHKIKEVIWAAAWPDFATTAYVLEDAEFHVQEYELTTEDEVYDWARDLIREIEGPGDPERN